VRVSVTVGAQSGFRGESLEVSGRVSGDGELAGLPIELFLDGPAGALRVGGTVCAADGTFTSVIALPAALALGNYHVIAHTPGDDQHTPAASRPLTRAKRE
jgi:hypothetical protein